MRLLRWLGRGLLALVALGMILLVLGPYEPVDLEARFDRTPLEDGVDAYLRDRELRVPGLRPGFEKRVVWYGLEDVPTSRVVVYFHSFAGSSAELRPVPTDVAQALGANLVLARFTGHGRNGAAMAEARVSDWMHDAAEALAIAREIGDDVIVVATSTGGTIAAVAARDAGLMRDVKGVVLISPNFGMLGPYAGLSRLPAARLWLPLMAGRSHSISAQNADHARHWTTRFPTVALLPVAALVRHAAGLDYGQVSVPALFLYSDDDQVARADQTDRIMAAWGGQRPRAFARC